MRLVAGAAVALLLGGAAVAAPPPPPVFPKEFPETLDGYALQPIFSVYNSWVGRGRGPALKAAISKEYGWQGKRFWRSILESEVVHHDFGVIRADRLDLYCGSAQRDGPPGSDCEYRYRYAFVPGSLYSDKTRQPLIVSSFRPEELTKLLRSRKWQAPAFSGGYWQDDRLKAAFERHTDLLTFYAPFVEHHEVTSSKCPALEPNLDGLDKITLDIAPNRLRDTKDYVPIHGQTTVVRLSAMSPSGGAVIIEGKQSLSTLLQPLWDAVEACVAKEAAAKAK